MEEAEQRYNHEMSPLSVGFAWLTPTLNLHLAIPQSLGPPEKPSGPPGNHLASALSWWLQLDPAVSFLMSKLSGASAVRNPGVGGVFLSLRMALDEKQHPAPSQMFPKRLLSRFCFSVRASNQQQGFLWVLATEAKPLPNLALPMLQPRFFMS